MPKLSLKACLYCKMKFTKIQKYLKTIGIAARRFNVLTKEEAGKVENPSHYDVYQSELAFSPWLADADFLKLFGEVSRHSLVGAVRCWVLYSAVRQALNASGELWECRVYRGGTALMLRRLRDSHAVGRMLRLFDSFQGMPETDALRDVHKAGDFADTSLEAVRSLVGDEGVEFHAGFIPASFVGLACGEVAFAHVDLDLHDAILESCKFIYPRLTKGAVMVFDDYGFPSCPGARIAVDGFFRDKPEFPMVLPTAQAIVHKL